MPTQPIAPSCSMIMVAGMSHREIFISEYKWQSYMMGQTGSAMGCNTGCFLSGGLQSSCREVLRGAQIIKGLASWTGWSFPRVDGVKGAEHLVASMTHAARVL